MNKRWTMVLVAVGLVACTPPTEPVGAVDTEPETDTAGSGDTQASESMTTTATDGDTDGATSASASATDTQGDTDGTDSLDTTGADGECPATDPRALPSTIFTIDPPQFDTFTRDCVVAIATPLQVTCDNPKDTLDFVFDSLVELPPFEVGQTLRIEHTSLGQIEWGEQWLKIRALDGDTSDWPWLAAGQSTTLAPDGQTVSEWLGIASAMADPLVCPSLACDDGSGGEVSLARVVFGFRGEQPLFPGESTGLSGKDQSLSAYLVTARRGACGSSLQEQTGWYAWAIAGTTLN
jgi:hypothetical protein